MTADSKSTIEDPSITVYSDYVVWRAEQDSEPEGESSLLRAAYDMTGKQLQADLVPRFTYRLQACYYCHERLKAEENERVDRSDGNGWWVITDTDRHHCPSCGWWFVVRFSKSGPHSYSTYEHHKYVTYEGIVKRYSVSQLEVPVGQLRMHLLKRREHIAHIHPRKFELLVGEIFRDFFECEVRHVGGPGDNGIDLYAIIGDEHHLIQVKRRSSLESSEPVTTVREFIGALLAHGAQQGHIVTTASHFTRSAIQLAQNVHIKRQKIDITLSALRDIYDMLEATNKQPVPLWKTL